MSDFQILLLIVAMAVIVGVFCVVGLWVLDAYDMWKRKR